MPEITVELLLQRWLPAFLLTLAVEVPLYVVLTRGIVPPGRAAVAGGLGTVLTHPLLWFVWPRVVTTRAAYLVSGELLVCLLETLVFWRLARPVPLLRAAAAAFLANAASYGAGVLARGLGLY